MKKFREKFNTNKKIIIVLILLLILLIGGSYALLRVSVTGQKGNVLIAGGLSLELDDSTASGINIEKTVPMSDEKGLETEEYTFMLKNNGTVDSDYTIYLDDETLDENETRMLDKYVKYSLVKNEGTVTQILTSTGTNPNRVIDTGIIEKNKTNTYSLKVWIDSNADNEVMNTIFKAKLRVEANQHMESNKNIKAVYVYDQTNTATLCITGEEATCQISECYKNRDINSCSAGTIVKYAVNDTIEKYFYVIHDDGEKMTLQQRENTIRNVAWYSGNGDNSKGPLTILPQLEAATSEWNNVNNQTYTMGVTDFNETNAFTGCSSTTCTSNVYTLGSRTGKARMITIQETNELGCRTNVGSCPKWMYNYLYQSTLYGGTIDDNVYTTNYNNGYWTMSSDPSNSTYVWLVYLRGIVGSYYSYDTGSGARAVIVINK